MFAFMISPVSNSKISFVVHLHYSYSMSFTDNVIDVIKFITEELLRNNIRIMGYSFDGEPKLRSKYTNKYFDWIWSQM